jgi:hypothetical protein
VISKEEFEAYTPCLRGYAVYMFGAREDQPNIPDERNPYPPGSDDAREWDEGNRLGARHAQDGEE